MVNSPEEVKKWEESDIQGEIENLKSKKKPLMDSLFSPEFVQVIVKRHNERATSGFPFHPSTFPESSQYKFGEMPEWQYLGTPPMSSFEEGRLEGYSDASKIYESVIEKLEERIQELEKV